METENVHATAASLSALFTFGSFKRDAGVNHLLFYILNVLFPLWGDETENKTKTPGQSGKTSSGLLGRIFPYKV